jgi:hypothetical protein
VLLANDMDGSIHHWIFGHHGKTVGARLSKWNRKPLAHGKRLIIYSPYQMRSYDEILGLPEETTWMRNWDDVIDALQAEHGPGSKVAVLPDATMGIPENFLDDWKIG